MMRTKILFSIIPLSLVCAACMSSRAPEQAEYSPIDVSTPSPVSDHGGVRVYSGTASAVESGASPDDLRLGREIRELLLSDKKLAPPPSSVTAITRGGVVRLEGSVPSVATKKTISDRIAQLPGVARVDDQLQVHWYR